MPTPTPQSPLSLEQLAALSGLPRRTVRYYIQLGLVDRPEGEKRGAHYLPRHLEQLLTIQKFTTAGLSLEKVADLLRAPDLPPPVAAPRVGTVEVRSHLTLADGVELVVEAGRAGLTSEQVRQLFTQTLALYARVIQENDDER